MTNQSPGDCVSGNIPANTYNNGLGFDTGLDLLSGGEYTIAASGSWSSFPGFPQYGPDGGGPPPGITAGELFIAPNSNIGALVGRIGTTGGWFTVGSSLDFIATTSGRLYLIANDLNDAASFASGWSGNVQFTACLITAPPLPQINPVNTANNNVNITYINGTGPSVALLGSRILLYSDPTTSNNELTCVFTPAVNITIKANPFWTAITQLGLIFLSVETPLGTQTKLLEFNQNSQPIELPPSTPVTKLSVSNQPNTPQYQLDISLDNYVINPVTLPTYDPTDALSVQRQQELASEMIATAINNFALTAQRQGEASTEGISNSVITLGTQLADQAAKLTENTTTIIGALATQLTNSFATNINDFASQLSQALSGVTGVPQGVIEAAINALKALIEAELKLISDGVNAQLSFAGKSVLPALTQAATTVNKSTDNQSQIVQNLLHGKYTSLDQFYNALNASGANTGLLKSLQDTFTIISTISVFIKARLISAEVTLNQLTLSSDTPNLNDINTIVLGYFRGYTTYEQASTELAKYGLNQSRVNELFTSRALLVGLSDIKTAFQRNIISEIEHDTLLSQYGISPGNIELLKSVYPMLPTPSDITRMADKHIFAPDIPQIFGQNSELDQGYLDKMSEWGIASDDVRKLWASHWSLPGLQETFDMWHRGQISDNELDVYFKLTDILPFFRDKLKTISHNLITRVDIRRMYHVGVFTQQDVYDAYVKDGYSATDAEKLTQFTVINDRLSELPKAAKIRSLTESMVVKALKEGIITEQDAINKLGTVGYLPADASLILRLETQTANIAKTVNKTQYYHDKTVNLVLSDYAKGVFGRNDARNYLIAIGVPSTEADQELYYADLERITQLKSLVINHVRTAYTSGQIDKGQATNLMLNFGFGMSEVELLFEELDILKSLRNKPLTLAQLTSLVKKGIITAEQFAQELANLGYNDTHVSWLVQETFGV